MMLFFNFILEKKYKKNMVRRFFLGFFGDYHGFAFFWDGRKYGVMTTLLHRGLNDGRVLKLLP